MSLPIGHLLGRDVVTIDGRVQKSSVLKQKTYTKSSAKNSLLLTAIVGSIRAGAIAIGSSSSLVILTLGHCLRHAGQSIAIGQWRGGAAVRIAVATRRVGVILAWRARYHRATTVESKCRLDIWIN